MENTFKSYSKYQAAKLLRIGYYRLIKYCDAGIIGMNVLGRIPEEELQRVQTQIVNRESLKAKNKKAIR